MANGELIAQIDTLLDGGEINTKAASRMQLVVLRELYVKQDALAANLSNLSNSVKTHHDSFHLSPALKSPKFWGVVAVAFVLLHGLAEGLQAAGIQGWQTLAKLIGL